MKTIQLYSVLNFVIQQWIKYDLKLNEKIYKLPISIDKLNFNCLKRRKASSSTYNVNFFRIYIECKGCLSEPKKT